MKPVITPRELAEAIGVSESSVKRWTDDGLIRASRTAGGHRRLPIREALRFVRESRSVLVKPEILGLADLATVEVTGQDEPDQLFEYLRAGAAVEARGLLASLYLGGRSVPQLVDGPLRTAMDRIGELWHHDEKGVFFEHRATDIAIHALSHLRALLPPSGATSTRAAGGALAGDPYILPSLAVATTLEGEGLRCTNLGPDTPAGAFLHAAHRLEPLLVWVSVSVPASPRQEAEVRRLLRDLEGLGVMLVAGGRCADSLGLAPGASNLYTGSSMAELAAYAKGLAAA